MELYSWTNHKKYKTVELFILKIFIFIFIFIFHFSLHCTSTRSPTKSGTLLKKANGMFFSGWRERHFDFDQETNILSCSSSISDSDLYKSFYLLDLVDATFVGAEIAEATPFGVQIHCHKVEGAKRAGDVRT